MNRGIILGVSGACVIMTLLLSSCATLSDQHIGEGAVVEAKVKSVFPIQANLVFFYYKDLPVAQKFYEEILGFERVLDYGFASIHQISATSYIGLVDENRGMHKSTEPKTVTLAFITQELDEWHKYLKSSGVKLRGEPKSSTRHDTRGFIAYDPEGYLLEFETFLEGEENKLLNAQLAKTTALYPSDDKLLRPSNLGIQGNVFWLYYKDIPEAQRFYEKHFGLELVVSQGELFTKVYAASPTCFIGLVDEAQGLHRFTEEKAVTVSFFSEQIDDWYQRMTDAGLKMRSPLGDEEELVITFVTYDCGGYFLEFDKFLEDEKNKRLLELLK